MSKTSRNRSFTLYLSKIHDEQDRQALAIFRRSLSKAPGRDTAPYRYLGRFLGSGVTEREE